MSTPFYSSIIKHAKDVGTLPPVHLWDPPFCGHIGIRIDRQGQWHYQGKPMRRQPLVDLFSTVLKREANDYFLVTPHEKCGIDVDVAPLLIVEWALSHQDDGVPIIQLKTQQGFWFDVDAEHPIHSIQYGDDDVMAVRVRSNIDAVVGRNVYFQLSELLEEYSEVSVDGRQVFEVKRWNLQKGLYGLSSAGVFFPLAQIDQAKTN